MPVAFSEELATFATTDTVETANAFRRALQGDDKMRLLRKVTGWISIPIAMVLVVSPSTAASNQPPNIVNLQTVSWNQISLELSSGQGGPNRSWTIFSDGSGSFRQAVYAATPGRNYHLRVYDIGEASERLSNLMDILSRLPNPAPEDSDCRRYMYHMGNGALRLRQGATTIEIRFTMGCRDPEYAGFVEVLMAADAMITEARDAGTLVRTGVYENGELVRWIQPD